MAVTFHPDSEIFGKGATFKPDRPHPKNWMRCLPSEDRTKPAGEWNHYRVVCQDGSVKLHVNGKEVSGGTACDPLRAATGHAGGIIALFGDGSVRSISTGVAPQNWWAAITVGRGETLTVD